MNRWALLVFIVLAGGALLRSGGDPFNAAGGIVGAYVIAYGGAVVIRRLRGEGGDDNHNGGDPA